MKIQIKRGKKTEARLIEWRIKNPFARRLLGNVFDAIKHPEHPSCQIMPDGWHIPADCYRVIEA